MKHDGFWGLLVRTLGTFRGVLGYFKACWCELYEHFWAILGVLKAKMPSHTAFLPEVRTLFCHFEPSGANFGKIYLDATQDFARRESRYFSMTVKMWFDIILLFARR